MGECNFMQGCVALLGLLAVVALALTAFGIMLGLLKPADALKRVAAVVGVLVALMFIQCVLVSAWSGIYLWQQIALIAVGICVWLLSKV